MTTAVSNDEIHQPPVNMLEELGNINSRIAISEFFNYKDNDKQILLQLFCLTITLLNRSKDEINKIGKKDEKETLYDKLVDGLIVKLKEKL